MRTGISLALLLLSVAWQNSARADDYDVKDQAKAKAAAYFALRTPLECQCGPDCECESCRCGTSQDIRWTGSYDWALQKSHVTGRPLFVSIASKVCPPCRRMEETTYKDPAVVKALAEKFVTLKLDADTDNALVNALGVTKLPAVVIAMPDGTIKVNRTGYQDAALLQAEMQAATAPDSIPMPAPPATYYLQTSGFYQPRQIAYCATGR